MFAKWFKNIGPGPLIAAAFIGPGTVTVCTIAGAQFGFALMWALGLSVFATIVLQEMSARLGLVSQKGLSEIIKSEIKSPQIKWLVIVLMLSAIVIGNAAYEAGNISGAILGMETIFGTLKFTGTSLNVNFYSLIIGFLAFVILFIGNYKVLERTLIFLVLLMSFAFLVTAIVTKPDFGLLFKGMFSPSITKENILIVAGLIGTTVVPYNLFLHASLVKEKWQEVKDLHFVRRDTFIAIILGGIVSMSIIVCASAIQTKDVNSITDLAKGLEPLFGGFAKYFLSVGLFAAGITSAITAPLAAAYVASGCFGWSSDLKSKRFRAVWIFILIIGVFSSSINLKSIEIIKFAQIANGVLLPVVAGILLWVVNKKSVLGEYKNSKALNILGFLILGITIFIGLKTLLKVFEII